MRALNNQPIGRRKAKLLLPPDFLSTTLHSGQWLPFAIFTSANLFALIATTTDALVRDSKKFVHPSLSRTCHFAASVLYFILSTGLHWLQSENSPQTGSIPSMGVPKFFRWMSERYPAISQVISGSRIPEFDCLYLDMNSIIHNCTHSDSDSPTFRMTEDQMFIRIFNYIEHLFGIIQPKHLFFMAIDGVAPRAKMNQQRARRFRTA